MMKRTLLIFAFAMFSMSGFAQITAGETSDFEIDTEGWSHQISNPNDPVQVADGEPNGAGDGYLSTSSTGTNGSGSRHIFANVNAEWTGSYTSAGIVALTFDVRNTSASDLHLRVAFNGTGFNDWAASTDPVVVSAGSGWTSVSIPVQEADLTLSGTPTANIADILANVSQVRILSNDGTDTLHKGQNAALNSDYDNITATDVLGIDKFTSNNAGFRIVPNPSTHDLNISVFNTDLNNVFLEVYDLLGKQIYKALLPELESSIDVSNWKSGVYLVKVSHQNFSQTKRFVKY